MMLLFCFMTMILIIMLIMTLLVNLVSKKTINDREKSSPFECGFDPKTLARLPFSLQFFLVAVIFLIFDVEITLLFPMMINLKFTNPTMMSITVIFFVLVLVMGLYHEWKQNALDWTL